MMMTLGLFCLVGEGLEKLLLASIGQGTESITSSDTWQTQKRNSTLTSSKSGDVRLYRTATQPRGHFQKTGNLNVLRFNQDDNDKHRRKCPSKSRCGLFQLVCRAEIFLASLRKVKVGTSTFGEVQPLLVCKFASVGWTRQMCGFRKG
jgi:hypothetical protein